MQLNGLCSGNGTSMADPQKGMFLVKLLFTTESNRTSHVNSLSSPSSTHYLSLSISVLLQLYIHI